MTQKNTNKIIKNKKVVALSLTAALAVSICAVNPIPTHAAGPLDIIQSTIDKISGKVETNLISPDTPITFNLEMTKSLLKELNLEYKNGTLKQKSSKSEFGVYVSGGGISYLATVENGLIEYSTDGTNISINVIHPTLDRYTEYTSYLINKTALIKVENALEGANKDKGKILERLEEVFDKLSDKLPDKKDKFDEIYSKIESHFINHSNFGNALLDKVIQTLLNKNISEGHYKTGSAIGEATQIKIDKDSVETNVLENANIEITAKDDYGNIATSGKVEVVNTKTTDGSELSDTLKVSEDVNIVDGKAEIQVSNHKAQALELTVKADSLQGYDKTFVVDVLFNPGIAENSTIELEDNVTVGNDIVIKGKVTDKYENPVLPTSVDISIGDSIVTVETGENGMYETKLTVPTTIDQSKGLSEIVDVLVKTKDDLTIKEDKLTINPEIASKVVIDEIGTVTVGSENKITGYVKDKYGNNALQSKLKLNVNVGTIVDNELGYVLSDQNGKFEVVYKAPTTPTKDASVSIGSEDGFVVETSPALFEVVAATPSEITSTIPNAPKQGEITTITGIAKDEFGNVVSDGTVITITEGTNIIGTVTTVNGEYSVEWKPQASGDVTIGITSGDFTTTTDVKVTPSLPTAKPFDFSLSATSVERDRVVTISGYVQDLESKYMPVGTVVNVSIGNEVFETTIQANGYFSHKYTPTKAGTFDIVVTVGEVESSMKTLNVKEAGSVTIGISSSSVVSGNSITISGYAKDVNGNALPDGSKVYIKNGSSSVTSFTTKNGTGYYSGSYTPWSTGTMNLTANINSVTSSIVSLKVTPVLQPTLTMTNSKEGATVGYYTIYTISGYAKYSDGTPMVGKTIYLSFPKSIYNYHGLLDQDRTDKNGYYSFEVMGGSLDLGAQPGYVYMDNEKGYGSYNVPNTYAYSDFKLSTWNYVRY